ncbi:DUF2490 domain-containing protein [Flavobacterium collinsii]|uniref:DUF2490 domain-containing protein n=1 Tax=Flavobacterium collinsii TaxID=1114861 RepID=UPI00375783B7
MQRNNFTKFFCLFMFLFSVNNEAIAQRTAVCFFTSHKHQLNHIWAYADDLQLKTEKPFSSLQTALARTWVNYALSDHSTIGLSYVHFGNWQQQPDVKFFRVENRILEEFKTKTALGNFDLSDRFRLEQPFFTKENRAECTQPLRYQFVLNIPLSFPRLSDRLTKIIVQNELFLNLQNKKVLNNSFFLPKQTLCRLENNLQQCLGNRTGVLLQYTADN